VNYLQSAFEPEVPANGASPRSVHGEPRTAADANTLFKVLNQSLTTGAHAPESIFRAATDAARTLTDADGVAVALKTDAAIVCRARSGPIAPDLGAKLDSGSGISGECLRTAEMLRCDDTETDTRVDPVVCRHLGVRSMVAVPIRGQSGTAGILEAFSIRPYAFGMEQISLLSRLAEIVEAAYRRECGAEPAALDIAPAAIRQESFAPRPVEVTSAELVFDQPARAEPKLAEPVFSQSKFTESRLSEPRTLVEASVNKSSFKQKYIFWFAGASAAVLLVVSVIVWNWRDTDREVAQAEGTQTLSQPATNENASTTAPIEAKSKPAAVTVPIRTDGPSAKNTLQNASDIQSEPVTNKNSSALALSPTASPQSAPAQPTDSAPIEPPTVTIVPDNANANLGNLVSNSPKLPNFDPPVSEGVTGAKVIHQVPPAYPAGARNMRIEGSVVIDVTIGEDGIPRDLTLISGQPLLAQAARDAIRQWRYQPALLNGKPVALQQRITVVFKVP